MKPTKAGSLAFLLLLCPAIAAYAQEGSAPAAADGRSFEKGDQSISLAAGVIAPLFTFGGDSTTTETKLYAGASFSLGYQYFIAHGLAIGGTIGSSFNGTFGGRTLVVVPLTFRLAYWWSVGVFELAPIMEVGAYLSRVSGTGMIGPFAKAGGAASWRLNNDWSLGVQFFYWFIPEIHTGEYADLTRFGNYLEASVFASYHL